MKKSRIFAVYGASGFGREVMPLLRQEYSTDSYCDSSFIFIDDDQSLSNVNGHEVYTYNEFLGLEAESKNVVLAIANDKVRKALANKCAKDNITIVSICASSVVKMDKVSISEGIILCPFVTLTSNITIGKHFHANIYSYVAHDCVIGDFVTFAPSVQCNGNVHIDDHVYVGTGAIIKQGLPDKPLRIGAGAIIGMGAVVTKDVPPNTTVVGNPAKAFTKN